jgi:serine-type D-Ala-D-Ala carboxypeptidase (penicillin-binding protein 5/6)
MHRRQFLRSSSLILPAFALPSVADAKTKRSSASSTSSTAKKAEEPSGEGGIKLYSEAAVLIDAATGRLLFAKNATQERQVASTQKLMTALLICESGDLDRLCTVEEYETKASPTKMFIKTGQQYSRKELLKALLIKSANDCAACLARCHSGSESAFAELMTRRAKQLGMNQSLFKNANGLPAEQHSTAYDMALLARVALQQPVIRDLVATKRAVFNHADGKPRVLDNTNHLLESSPYCHGMKTGYTEAAGKCLVSCASHKGRTVIAVLLGSSLKYIWKESKLLLHAGLGVPS